MPRIFKKAQPQPGWQPLPDADPLYPRLREIRLAQRLSAEEVGHIIGLVSSSHLAPFEKGSHDASIAVIRRVADAYGYAPVLVPIPGMSLERNPGGLRGAVRSAPLPTADPICIELRRIRMAAGWPITEVVARMGRRNTRWIGAMETGKIGVRLSTLRLWARALARHVDLAPLNDIASRRKRLREEITD